MTEVAFIAEEVAEFIDAPAPGISLFVQATWSAGLPEKLPEGADAVLCRLLACDGLRCWEGAMRRADLSGPLGDSWAKQSNLRLLMDALAARAPPSSVGSHDGGSMPSIGREADLLGAFRDALPVGEAAWTCTQGHDAALSLTIRFVYREGPVVAVRGVSLVRSDVNAGLSRFFALAHGAQTAASACIAAAEAECAQLREQQDILQRRLEALPKETEDAEDRLLQEMAHALNNQKRRCRQLFLASCQASATEGPEVDPATVSLVQEPATMSLEACLDRSEPPAPPEDIDATDDAFQKGFEMIELSAPSLVFASDTLMRPAVDDAGEGSAFTFTIPLTLGMSDYGNAPSSGKRTATGESLLARAGSRRKVGNA